MKVTLPQILHFRIPSVGPDKPQFTHPFPINEYADLRLEGSTKGRVLFHNGTWGPWVNKIQEIGRDYRIDIPLGEWSDSRGLAFAAYCAGAGWLSFQGERVAIMGPEGINVFAPHGWSKVADGFWASNMGWNTKEQTSYTGDPNLDRTQGDARRMAIMGPAMRSAQTLLPNEEEADDDEKAGGTSHPGTFCHGGNVVVRGVETLSGKRDQSSAVQEGERGLHSRLETGSARVVPSVKDTINFRAWVSTLNPKNYRAKGGRF